MPRFLTGTFLPPPRRFTHSILIPHCNGASTPARVAPSRTSKFLSFMDNVPGNADLPINPGSSQQLLDKSPPIEETGTYTLDWSSKPDLHYQPDFIPVKAADVLTDMLSGSVMLNYTSSMHDTKSLGARNITKQPHLSAHFGPKYRSAGCTYKETPMSSELLIITQGLNTLLG